ncbi:hypothetical protein Xbed_00709 [Xenorhabdus beddingii]|uniref:Uncharacterized protein n=1 Tax=Xenorhabdus beddingii TaxID=40578 RepID=A0A1Y2SQI4_9GAMM|nr:hypothetical protein [Xenorhabdus beddingii]OTA21063.1 hypothetical protein Xbed_00709 [Xenorhabdus beddingii]
MAAWVIDIPLATQGNGQRNIAFSFRVVLIVQYYSLVIGVGWVYWLMQNYISVGVIIMSRLHRNCYDVLRRENNLISQCIRSNGCISLEICHPRAFVIEKIDTRFPFIRGSAEILLIQLGFKYYNPSACELLPHSFDLDIMSYEQNIITPLSSDNFNGLNFAFLVRNIQNGARPLISQPSHSWNPVFSNEHEQLLQDALDITRNR